MPGPRATTMIKNDPWVTDTGTRIKAWYVMRRDIEMSSGKLAIQIGHGTDLIHIYKEKCAYYDRWIDPSQGNRRKILLRAKTEAELLKVETECLATGMIVYKIKDAGLTEFNGETLTGIVIFPHDDGLIPKVLKKAQSWKDV